jgi:hypothetical protein
MEQSERIDLGSQRINEEPAKLNRDVALRAVRPNSQFSNVFI